MQQHQVPFKVALCGRPNVGKSSIFNRFCGRRKALVLDLPGVTRDVRIDRFHLKSKGHNHAIWIEMADLAGLEELHFLKKSRKSSSADLKTLAEEAALQYLNESDLVLLVIDGRSPLTPNDFEIYRFLKKAGKRIFIILSKIEGQRKKDALAEYAELAEEKIFLTSAEENEGFERIKEEIISFAERQKPQSKVNVIEESQKPLCIGIYGRPNTGKSTLVNSILGQDRMITSAVAGTTVDTIDTDFRIAEKAYRILDTAGIRRKSKTEAGVEVLSVVQALKSLQNVDVALLVIDGFEGIMDQDEKIAGELLKSGKPIVIVINKWDLCKVPRKDYADRVRETLRFLEFVPLVFLSAKENEGIEVLWDLFDEILRQRKVIAPTPELNRFVELLERSHHASGARVYYATQTHDNPPTITFMVNDPKKIHFDFERYLKNELRSRYGWMGSPIRLIFKARTRSKSKYTK